MAPKVKDLGVWNTYTPDPLPNWAQNGPPGQRYMFTRRDSDGADWYVYRLAKGSFTDGYLLATTLKEPNTGHEIVNGIHRDRTSIAIPFGMRVIEIEDVNPDDPAPWKPYEQKIYDPATRTFSEEIWQPPVMAVRDFQFAGQANAEGIITDQEADDWVATGVVPEKLVTAVKAAVTDPERQRRVILFLKGTTSFPRFHELTPLLAASFGKNTPELLDAFFLAASKR